MNLENSTQTNAQKTPTFIRNGYTKVPNAIFSRDLSPEEKITYIALLSYDWYKKGCYPSREILSKDTGISERTLVEVIKKLKKKELIINKRRGNGQTNYYTLPPIVLPGDSPSPKTKQAAASNEIERLTAPVVEPETHAVSSAPAKPISESIAINSEPAEPISESIAINSEPAEPISESIAINSEPAEPISESIAINSDQDSISIASEPETAVTVCEQKADLRSAGPALLDTVRSAGPALPLNPEKDAFKTEKDTQARQSAPVRSRKRERTSVGVKTKSRFSLEECKRYAQSLVGAGIKSPIAFAKSVWTSGTDDEAIREFLRMEAETEAKRIARQAEQEARRKSQLQEAARFILEEGGPTKDWEYQILKAAGVFYPSREGV